MTYSPELRNELKTRLQRLCDEKLLIGNPERLRQLTSEAVEKEKGVRNHFLLQIQSETEPVRELPHLVPAH